MTGMRLTLRVWLVVVAVAALVLAVAPTLWLIGPTFHAGRWSAIKGVPLVVRVVDRASGKPVAGATVLVTSSRVRGLMPPGKGTTDRDGRAAIEAPASARGTVYTAAVHAPVVLWKTERLSTSGVSVQASAPGYAASAVVLGEGPGREVTVRLAATRPPG